MRYRRLRIRGACYFFTIVTHERQPVLATPEAVAAWRQAIAAVAAKWAFVVEAEVILPDHVHTMWTLPEGDADFPTRIRLVKRHVSMAIGDWAVPSPSRAAKGERTVWQRRYWEHLIRDDADFEAHLDYIHLNPVKHGLVSAARDWSHSTFSRWVAAGRYDDWWGSDDMAPLPDWVGRE